MRRTKGRRLQVHKLNQLFCVRHIYLLSLTRMHDGDLESSIAGSLQNLLLSFDSRSFLPVEETHL